MPDWAILDGDLTIDLPAEITAATGIDALRTIVANLRAWTLPYSIPIVREDLYEHQTASFTALYQERFKRLSELLVEDTLPVYGS